MAFLHPESGDFGTLINAFAVGFLVLPRRLFLALLTFQGIRHFGHRDGQIPGPQFVVERVGAAHLIFREQVMKSGICIAIILQNTISVSIKRDVCYETRFLLIILPKE